MQLTQHYMEAVPKSLRLLNDWKPELLQMADCHTWLPDNHADYAVFLKVCEDDDRTGTLGIRRSGEVDYFKFRDPDEAELQSYGSMGEFASAFMDAN